MDPVTISSLALGVSALGFGVAALNFGISTYRAGVDRRLQWEQLRGGMFVRLNIRGMEVALLGKTLNLSPSSEKDDLVTKLVRIAEATVEIRRKLSGMQAPRPLVTSKLLTAFAPLKTQLDDADLIFENLKSAVEKMDLAAATSSADGLIERLYGSRNTKA